METISYTFWLCKSKIEVLKKENTTFKIENAMIFFLMQ